MLSCKTLPYRKSSKKNKGYGRNRPQYHHIGHRNHVIANMCIWKVHIIQTVSMYSSIMLQPVCITKTWVIAETIICEIHRLLHVWCHAPSSSVKACSNQYNSGEDAHISTGKPQNLSNLTRHMCCLVLWLPLVNTSVIMNINIK